MIRKGLPLLLLGGIVSLWGSSIRFMTFNIRRDGKEELSERKWQHRKKPLIDFIKQQDPDIFGLQEATEDQLIRLSQTFPEYAYVGKGRGSAWFGWSLNEFNPIFFKKDKFRIIKKKTFNINKSGWFFDVVTKGKPVNTGYLHRICTFVLLQNKETGKLVSIYNTHLDNHFEKARINGIKKIGKFIRKQERKLSGLLTILMGDFNSPLEGKFAQKMKKIDGNFIDTRSIAQSVEGSPETANHWGEKPATAIDHIMVKNVTKCKVLYNKTCDDVGLPYLSDHWAVITDIEIT